MKFPSVLFWMAMLGVMLACEKKRDPTPVLQTCVLDTINNNGYNLLVNQYNAAGQVIGQQDILTGSVVATTQYEYAEGRIGRIVSYNTSDPTVAAYQADILYTDGNWIKQTYSYKNGGRIVYTATYNAANQIKTVEEYDFNSTNDTLQYYRRDYLYEKGNMTSERYYNYDYLFKVRAEYTTEYEYDPAWTIWLSESEKYDVVLSPGTPSPSKNPYTHTTIWKEPAHELVGKYSYTYEYNAAGNIIKQVEFFADDTGKPVTSFVLRKHFSCK